MKLRNKKTGELVDINLSIDMLDKDYITEYGSLEEFNKDWEDAPEEPKKYWFIDADFGICGDKYTGEPPKYKYEIGNYFKTKEEAERAVEKLKAWKRLKDKGFRFSKDWVYRYDQPKVENHTYFELVAICEDGVRFDDLDLLFGGGE